MGINATAGNVVAVRCATHDDIERIVHVAGSKRLFVRAPSFLTQVLFDTSTLRQLHINKVEDPQWTIWFGLRHRLGERFWVEAGFGEDLVPDVPPDFTAWLGFVFDLGG